MQRKYLIENRKGMLLESVPVNKVLIQKRLSFFSLQLINFKFHQVEIFFVDSKSVTKIHMNELLVDKSIGATITKNV